MFGIKVLSLGFLLNKNLTWVNLKTSGIKIIRFLAAISLMISSGLRFIFIFQA